MRESEAQSATRYKSRLQMEIQLEMIAAHTCTIDDVYQLVLKIEGGLKFRVSRSKFTNWEHFLQQDNKQTFKHIKL